MGDRGDRFTEDLVHGLVGQQPIQLLNLFKAKTLKEMVKNAATSPTNLSTLQQEAMNYLGKLTIQSVTEFAKLKTHLPVECAFALHAYTRDEVYKELNKRLRNGSDLQDFQQLCICLIKGLALLPPHERAVFRCMKEVQSHHVCRCYC